MASLEPAEDRNAVGINWHIGRIHEDIVTAHAFSTLRYVPRTCDAFLRDLVHLNRATLGGADPFHPRSPVTFEAWPGWRVPASKARTIAVVNKMVEQELRSPDQEPSPSDALRLKGSVIPDVVLRGRGWNLVIEAEWSYQANVPQLVEQVLLAPDNLPESASRTYVVLVNRRVSPPGALPSDVERVLARVPDAGVRTEAIVGRILWFNWQGVASIFSDAAADDEDALVLRDQLAFLARAEIQPSADFPLHQLADIVERTERIRHTLRSHELRAIRAAVQASRNLVGVLAHVHVDPDRPRA